MSSDARYGDGAEHPLRLRAESAEDLQVMAALTQDAVCRRADAAWLGRKRRFVLLLNRFRWEDKAQAERAGRPFERVRSLLEIENALSVRVQGVDPGDDSAVLCLLDLAFEPGEDGTGRLRLTLAGGGAVEIAVEALEVTLSDASRPYLAQAGAPDHSA